MAKIKIRGRLEPIELDNARAQKIKNRKFGNGNTPKAEPTDLVDLGEWSGEYSRIVEIELTTPQRDRFDPDIERRREEKEAEERWAKMTPEQKGKSTGWFGLAYSSTLCDFSARPSEELLKKVRKVQTEYYKKNPEHTRIPSDTYGDLLPKRKGTQSLAEKMSVNIETPNGRKCKNIKCGTELTGTLKDFCSGKCMLIVQNGELSTE